MKTNVKKLLAFALVVCTLLGLTVPAAMAESETVVYDFYNNVTWTYPCKGENWAYECHTGFTYNGENKGNANMKSYADNESMRIMMSPDQWVAFRITVPESETYSVELKVGAGLLGTPKGEAYIIPVTTETMTADDVSTAIKSATAQFTFDCSAHTTDANSTEWKTTTNTYTASYTFEEEAKYIVVFKALEKQVHNTSSTKGYVFLKTLTMTPVAESYEAAIGNEKYDTLENAFSAAEKASSGTTVQLLDGVPEKDKVEIPVGVTLDLNGNDLTASEVTCAVNAKIIDSVGGGLLDADTITTQPGNGGYLPLMDTDAGGYRLYEAKIEALGINSKTADGDSAKFWFNLHFTKSEAYTLIEKGNTGFGFAANMKWNETDNITAANADATFIGTWAEAVAQDAGKDVGLKVTGLSDVTGFTLTPVVSANGVTVSASALSLS